MQSLWMRMPARGFAGVAVVTSQASPPPIARSVRCSLFPFFVPLLSLPV